MIPLPLPFLWLALAPAPQATPSFPTEVEVITVDAIVVDKDNRLVTGLTRDEFRVLEDGKPREIVSFEEYTRGEASVEDEEPAAPPAVVSNARGTELRGRAFALLLDDVFTPLQGSAEVRQAAAAFLRSSVGPGDEVTISTTSGNAYWSAGLPEGLEDLLAVAARFKGRDTQGRYGTQEYGEFHTDLSGTDAASIERARNSMFEMKRMTELQAYDIVNGRRQGDRQIAFEIDHIRKQRMKITLAAVRRQLDALATVRGRKSLILLSPGFLQDDTPDIRETAAASRRANTALYFVDVRGLAGQNIFDASQRVEGGPSFVGLTGEEAERNLVTAGTQNLAQDTGGFSIRNVNDFGNATGRIAAESRSYYLLGIHPAEGKGQRDWRKLTVEVTRPGLKVRSRRGYSLRDALPPEEDAKGKDKAPAPTRKTLDPAVAGALDAAHAVSGIPLRVMVYVMEPAPKDMTRVLVAAEFDPRDLGRGASSAKLGFSVNITHRDTGRAFESNERAEVKLGAGAPEGWRAMAREFLLPAGVSSARVVVHDPSTGAMGAVTQRIEVPAASVFRVSTPVLSDQVDQSGKRPQAAVAVHREFLASGQLFCQFEVLGAARGPQGPRVAAGMLLRAADGTVIRRGELTPIAADPDGRVVRLFGMGLAGMKEGRYDLVLDVRDEVSGQQIQRSEPFTLTPSS
jgi:VWFA-related protein